MLARQRIQPLVTSIRRSRAQPLLFTRFLTSSTSDSNSSSPTTLAVIGGGLSGLSSAVYFLRNLTPEARKVTKVVVFEKQKRIGGWCNAARLVKGERVEHDKSLLGTKDVTIVFETGPRSIRPVGLQGWTTIELVSRILPLCSRSYPRTG